MSTPYISGDAEPSVIAFTGTSQPLDRPIDPYLEPDVMRRDRFELLSAYLDGEVTAQERAVVQHWLNTDPTVTCLYHRLLCLRQGCQDLCLGDPQGRVTARQVLQRLRYRLGTVTMATAGVLVLAALNLLSGEFNLNPTAEYRPQTGRVLEVTLDQPVFPIPKPQQMAPRHRSQVRSSPNLPIDSQL